MNITANGYILAGSWLNCMFYAVEVLLTIRYLHRSSHSLLHKAGVGGMFAFDTICTAAIFVRVYNVFLGFPLNVQPHNSSITNTIGVILLSTYGTASLEQLFLCCLYFNLTRRRFITAFLLLNIVVHLGFSYASAILVLHFRTSTTSAMMASKVGAITCSATDIMIATALLSTFIRIEAETGLEKNTTRRLIVLIFTSGCAVASLTLFTMVLILTQNRAYTVFYFIRGRIYALTIVGSSYVVRSPPEPTITLSSVSLPTTTIVSGNFGVGREGDSHTSPQVRSGAAYDHLMRSALLNVKY
ncbi:hypothetical protein DFH08DRAFT_971288 [Mycena albidolilacea]|uniref:Uncharacterized protein n=1 Tax=Mycena albidolilacea TaxID=1033008 RepID=A0AAD6ZDW4_9AGAR|nr:hypothetical protein DFH08DRAFT_971288 [Mycena albidolilacea]